MTDTLFSHPFVFFVIAALPLLGIVAKALGQSFARIAKWYCYIAGFAVIIVMDSIFFPFIGGKDWFFRYCVELALIAVFLWWAFEAKAGEAKKALTALVKNPLFISVSVFTFMVTLASIFAYDPHAAFWSNYERGEGAFQILHYYVFFGLLAFLFKKENEWRNLFKLSLGAAGIMIIYGLFGNFMATGFIGPYTSGAAPQGFWQTLITGRFEGSLGNPAYVAPYLMFAMFYAAYLWIARDGVSMMKGKARAWMYGVIIAIFFIFFILSQTRGAFIGLIAGVLVMLAYFSFSKNKPLKKWSAIICAVLIILGGSAYLARNTSFVQKLPAGRLLQLSLSDDTAQTRFWVWGEAWKGFLARPILGWGPENFTAVYDKYFNPKFFIPGQSTETWFDRAHSVFFDYLSETGILGLLAYLSIFVTFCWQFFRKQKKASEGHVKDKAISYYLERGLILALPVTYLVQGIAIFDVLPMYICLFTFLAFAYYYFNEKHESHV
jgi:O-antigen ligase